MTEKIDRTFRIHLSDLLIYRKYVAYDAVPSSAVEIAQVICRLDGSSVPAMVMNHACIAFGT